MKFFLIFSFLLCDCAFVATKRGLTDTEVIFYDDFEDFDLSVWQHEITMDGGGNNEFEYYTNNRSYVRDGVLYLMPSLTADLIGEANLKSGFTMDLWGGAPGSLCTSNWQSGCIRTSGGGGNILNPIQSAAIRTANSFHFTYGRVEINASLPKGDWLWPALWMLPRYDNYGGWPASGEIDIVESRGNANYPGGVNQFSSTLHWGPFWPEDRYDLTTASYKLTNGDFSDGFHVFGLLWTKDIIATYVDSEDNVVLKVPTNDTSFWEKGNFSTSLPGINNPWQGRGGNAPFDRDFYLIFNLAVGGTNGYFPDGVGGKPWQNGSPNAVNEFYAGSDQWLPTWQGESAALKIGWVRVTSL